MNGVPATVIRFESSILSLSLFPDSRGFCHFNLQEKEGQEYRVISSTRPLTCEYLLDLLKVTSAASVWIIENCDNICNDEGRHLYWKFREPQPDTPTPSISQTWWQRLFARTK